MHPSSKRFHELRELIGRLHDAKQNDYGTDTDPFANVRKTSNWGPPAYVGALIRLDDKVGRLQSMVRGNKLKNESAYDSFLDIAVYALIAYVPGSTWSKRPLIGGASMRNGPLGNAAGKRGFGLPPV